MDKDIKSNEASSQMLWVSIIGTVTFGFGVVLTLWQTWETEYYLKVVQGVLGGTAFGTSVMTLARNLDIRRKK